MTWLGPSVSLNETLAGAITVLDANTYVTTRQYLRYIGIDWRFPFLDGVITRRVHILLQGSTFYQYGAESDKAFSPILIEVEGCFVYI